MRVGYRFGWIVAMVLISLVTAGQLSAQAAATVTGRVAAEGGQVLLGVQVVATDLGTGNKFGAVTGEDGRYSIAGLRPGLYVFAARRVGYDPGVVGEIRLSAGESREIDFSLGEQVIALDAIEVFATRAIERVTPVAYTDVDKPTMEQQLGSQDIPLVLNTKPSVYSTEQGGASGDSRINVRGFDQRNVSVMINGVPVNDMENGWVYWSNWDGVGDATSSIQLQRGLSAVNLATPSIGGTMNIITDATSLTPGGMFKQEFGSDGFLKTTAMLASGLLGDKFAFMGQGVRKTGDGVAQGLWTDAWAYYFGASYKISNSNRLDLYAIGAPQRHGQRLYRQNIGAFSADFARSLDGYDPAALDDYPEARDGFRYNENWNSVSTSYTGLQAAGDSRFERQIENGLNERENFFHKPQVNLNWYSSLSETVTLTTVAYYSGGRGGGTGTAGDFLWDYSGPSRIADWDGNIAINQGTVDRRGNPKPAGEARGIIRNSRNNQWTIGAISKLAKQFSPAFTTELGVDWRTAEIDHFQEVRDLLGADYFLSTDSDFWSVAEQQRGLGDKISYHFTNTVDWLGSHLQGEYVTPEFTVYGMGGISTIKYSYTNHFLDDGTGNPTTASPDRIWGYQFKGGGLYNVTPEVGVYVNGGYVSRVPIFDGVVDDYAGAMNPDPQNESFLAFEGGLNYRTLDRSLAISLNGYFTQWNNRTRTVAVVLADGTDGLVSLLGLDAIHMGIEAEVAFQPSYLLRVDLGASLSNWQHTDDASGSYRPDARDQATVPYNYYLKDLKVGDAPQTQISAAVSVFPIDGLSLQLVGKRFARHWGAYNPADRTDPTDRSQSWRVPGYHVVDGHFSFTLPENLRLGKRVMLFAHVFNLLDEVYILDATDNSAFNGFDLDHDADDAEVNFGLQRRFNAGLQWNF